MTAKDLKNALLQEAVQGKLVPQIASEGNTRDLLEEIRKEKAKLIKEGKLKTEKPFEEIKEDEISFDIPANWCWCRIGDICNVRGGKRIPAGRKLTKENTGHKYIRVTDMKNGTVLDNDVQYITDDIYEIIKAYTISKDDVYITVAGTIGQAGTIPEFFDNANLTENADKLELYNTDKKFLVLMLNSPYIQKQIHDSITKVGQPKLAIMRIQTLVIALPPIAEQKRIVAAIEKFMPLIEEYGKKETELKAFNEQIGTLTKKAILQEAVQGKLVPQIAAEGNAKDLFEGIKKEKAKLIKEGKIKKEKPLPEITEDEIPFDIPENWCWCRLGEIVYNNGQKNPDKEFSYIDIGSIDNEHQKLNEKENFIEPQNAPSRARKIVKKGDIIYSTVRPYLHNMCIINKDFEKEPIASTGFAVLSCYPQINNQYLFYYLLSPSFDNYANDTENSKGVAYPAINDDRLYKGVVPIPPLTEQKRIVAAIEKLLPFCERLGEEK